MFRARLSVFENFIKFMEYPGQLVKCMLEGLLFMIQEYYNYTNHELLNCCHCNNSDITCFFVTFHHFTNCKVPVLFVGVKYMYISYYPMSKWMCITIK